MHGKYICSLSSKPYSGKTLSIQQMHRKSIGSLSNKLYSGKTLCTHIPQKGKEKLISSQFDTDVQAALTFMEVLHPRFADNYSTWIQIGMALKSVDPNLLEVWDSWSQLSCKYKPGECTYKWNSFKREGITIRTLAKYASIS